MRKWIEEYRLLWKNKYYRTALVLTSLFGYGYLITHETVGIDDTPYRYYFEEGLAAVVGRWVMFLVNKVIHIAEFAPFVTELAAVLIFMAGVTVWCVLLKRILGERIPMAGYILFSCLFLSNPLLSEVFTYYLHNGVATGYLCSGLSLCCFWEGFMRTDKGKKGFSGLQAVWRPWALSALCLWIAMGCYESFMIVYLTGVCVVLCTERLAGGKKENRGRWGIFPNLCAAAMIAVIGILFRSLTVEGIIALFRLEGLRGEAVQRSVAEMLQWMMEPEALAELAMILKRVFVMYGIFGYAYYPIKIYVLALVITGSVCVWRTVCERDPWILILEAGGILASYLLVLIEGKATLYRCAQFLPLFSAWGLLLVVYAGNKLSVGLNKGRKVVNGCISIALTVILWNQCTDMNHWFYVDDMKYQDAKNTMNQIAYELEKNFDTSKPVVFTGTYRIPKSIIQDAYVEYNTETYYKMKRLADLVDHDLLDKFNREYGVWVAQTPSLSVLDWGRYAFDNDEELIRFFSMHGHELQPLLDESLYAPAEEYSLPIPSFPAEGSIVDMGEYIIVHF